ncbi:MAG: HTH domain-containing protein [Bacteroidota bacterium]
MTFLELAEAVLKESEFPLTPRDIWAKAKVNGLAEKNGTKGRTPWATVGALLYVNVRDDAASRFVKIGKRPARFGLKGKHDLSKEEYDLAEMEALEKEMQRLIKEIKVREIDLHPLLVKFVDGDERFKARVRTIRHQKSKKRPKGTNQWLHPDLVGVYYPFEDYGDAILLVQKEMKTSAVRIFSFEMKLDLRQANLRQYFFQAVSNSSWAHEGYLVALSVDGSAEFLREYRMLNNAFGIGLIALDAENIFESRVLFNARPNETLDWDTMNRIAEDNSDFGDFMQGLVDDMKVGKVRAKYDEKMEDEAFLGFLREKGLVG